MKGAETSSLRTPMPWSFWAVASARAWSPAASASATAWRRHSTSSARSPPWWAISASCSQASAVSAPCRATRRARPAASPRPRRANSRPMGLNSSRPAPPDRPGPVPAGPARRAAGTSRAAGAPGPGLPGPAPGLGLEFHLRQGVQQLGAAQVRGQAVPQVLGGARPGPSGSRTSRDGSGTPGAW